MTTTKRQPITPPPPGVTVEYDFGRQRQRRKKTFKDPHKGKQFFTAKEKAGRNPKVCPAHEPGDTTTEKAKEEGHAPADSPKPPTTEKNDENCANKEPATANKEDCDEKPAPKKTSPPGVRAGRTRSFLAGTIIAKYGVEAGVTPEMVAELDELHGKPNPNDSKWYLAQAWHSLRGYTGGTEG